MIHSYDQIKIFTEKASFFTQGFKANRILLI